MRTLSALIVGVFIFFGGLLGSQAAMMVMNFKPSQLGALGATLFYVLLVYFIFWIAKTAMKKIAGSKTNADKEKASS